MKHMQVKRRKKKKREVLAQLRVATMAQEGEGEQRNKDHTQPKAQQPQTLDTPQPSDKPQSSTTLQTPQSSTTLQTSEENNKDQQETSQQDTPKKVRHKYGLFDKLDYQGKPLDKDYWEWSINVGWSILLGNLVGAVIGYRRGLQPAQDTFAMYSGVMHPEDVYLRIRKIRSNYIWMTGLKYSVLGGGTAGIFNGIYIGMRRYRQKSDMLNLSVAGLVTGALICVPMVPKYGVLPVAMGTIIGGVLGISSGIFEQGTRYLLKEYGGTELDLWNNPIKKSSEEQQQTKEENPVP